MTLPLISASQITSYRDCARKWGWGYIARIRSPQTPSQALGTEVDDEQLQPYLRDGRPFDFTRESGYIAASGLEYLPKPKTPGLEVQKHFVLPSPASGGAFAYQGYKDLWLPDSKDVPGMKGGVPFVGDFKTCKDFRWVKNEAALRIDVQAQLYATNAMFETGASEVDLRWIYLRTKGARQARATDLRVGADEVIEQFKAIEATALEMFDARKRAASVANTNEAVLALPPTPSHCDAYGGCPYQHLCNLSPAQKESAWGSDEMSRLANKGYVMGDTNSLLANLKAKKAGAQAATTEAPSGVVGSNPAGSAAPSPPAPLGINPPEKDLPPPEPKASRRTRGGKDPVGADAHAAVSEKQLPLPFEGIDYGKLADAIVDRLAARLAK